MTKTPPRVTTIHQIIDKDGKPYQSTATKALWVGYENQQFADVTTGNSITPYTTGKGYFEDLKTAIEKAESEILIAGWQVSWDALLAKGVRLFDALLNAAQSKAKLQIYVMPWNDAAPVQTFDDETGNVLQLINEITGRKCAHILLCKSAADESPKFFSHHQKQVVIDRETAFVGGIDVAYGRFDDATYALRADAEGRQALNRYNGCIAQVGKLDKDSVVDTDLLHGPLDNFHVIGDSAHDTTKKKLLAGAWQTPYEEDSPTKTSLDPVYFTIDATRQPRMPWQDVHCRIEGPAVSDLARNFIWRWNGFGGKDKLTQAAPASTYPKSGHCQIQVLRSAPKNHRETEYGKLPYDQQSTAGKPSVAEDDIARAMMTLIDKAHHFIYIENQFFVSDFGQPQGFEKSLSGPAQAADKVEWGMDQTTGAYISTTWVAGDRTTDKELPQNQICAALAKRIDTAIQDKKKHPFHVIITLPVHPEGCLNNGTIMTQVHWTMQTLVFGSHSLLNRIRRSLKAQQLREKKDPHPERVFEFGNHEYEEIPIKACFQYVTLLNLRNWEKLGDRYVTEQIYVHSKLMIVDDLYTILGSANINDRSLLGKRDSELAVLVKDEKEERVDLCGDGKMRPVRNFAHKLRCDVWRKIFGITGNVRPATELQHAIDHPGAPASWKAIQKRAMANAKLYEKAFDFIPRNKDPNNKRAMNSASIWPVWDPEQKQTAKPMPFEKAFWSAPQHNASGAAGLSDIKGFITTLPIDWTKNENNNFGYHTALVVQNDREENALPGKEMPVMTYAEPTSEQNNQQEVAT